jgi:hypothetical protein
MKLREKRDAEVSGIRVERLGGLKREGKKDFADEQKRCYINSLDRVRSSSLNLLSSETPKSISLGLRTQSIL